MWKKLMLAAVFLALQLIIHEVQADAALTRSVSDLDQLPATSSSRPMLNGGDQTSSRAEVHSTSVKTSLQDSWCKLFIWLLRKAYISTNQIETYVRLRQIPKRKVIRSKLRTYVRTLFLFVDMHEYAHMHARKLYT